ncbi:MAG TPA: hypothetical protein VIK50_17650 [Gemmatimonadaceae bacterium]
MRGTPARYAGFGLLAAGVAACAPAQQAVSAPPDVRVTITCPQVLVNVTVEGWVVHRNPGDQVVLQFASGANVTSITISPKDSARWPFTPGPPYIVQGGGQQVLTVNADAQPGTYRYNIVGTCTPPGGAAQSVTIDPDIVVD